MRSFIVLNIAGVCFATSALAQQKLNDDQIKNELVGKKVDWQGGGIAEYKADGKYEYLDSGARISRGTYKISDGKLCVEFDNKYSRCDTFGKDEKGLFMNARTGTYYGKAR